MDLRCAHCPSHWLERGHKQTETEGQRETERNRDRRRETHEKRNGLGRRKGEEGQRRQARLARLKWTITHMLVFFQLIGGV